MEQFVANQGEVCVYNWVEWLRENVKPHALSSSYYFILNTDYKEKQKQMKNSLMKSKLMLKVVDQKELECLNLFL